MIRALTSHDYLGLKEVLDSNASDNQPDPLLIENFYMNDAEPNYRVYGLIPDRDPDGFNEHSVFSSLIFLQANEFDSSILIDYVVKRPGYPISQLVKLVKTVFQHRLSVWYLKREIYANVSSTNHIVWARLFREPLKEFMLWKVSIPSRSLSPHAKYAKHVQKYRLTDQPILIWRLFPLPGDLE